MIMIFRRAIKTDSPENRESEIGTRIQMVAADA